jgi:4-hydroxy-4-methyl-2-oxoglutarate aldolase
MTFSFLSLPTVTSEVRRPDSALIERARAFPTSTLHEAAGKIGALPAAIKPAASSFRICGPAVTVHSPPLDNLWLHRAIYAAKPGDVLVVTVGGHYEAGYWGEVMSTAAKACGLGGLVIDGMVRDGELLEGIGFPVFARGLCMRGTGKDFDARGWINAPVQIDDVVIHPGDLVVGDADGVLALPPDRIEDTLGAAKNREEFEAGVMRRLVEGETTLDVFGLNR